MAQLVGGERPINHCVSEIIQEEDSAGMKKPETYIKFAKEIDQAKHEVLALLYSLKAEGKRIVGYGASHSTTTLIYHFELGKLLEYIVDDNPLKHGLYSPGYHIPVYPTQKIYEDKPECVIVLAWQYQEPIVSKNKLYSDQGGIFIVPLSKLKVV